MDKEPLTWHYGLMAEYWAEFANETPELDFLLNEIGRSGQPVLDLACGAGRLLVPLLKAGVDIDGCDLSADMLEQARRKAAAAGYSPQLFQSPMHSFSPPRRYQTILICGSFGLGGSRANDLGTLRRCYAALEDGGALIFEIDAEYTSDRVWKSWVPDNHKDLPEPWQGRDAKTASDGSQRRQYFRMLSIDPLEQNYTRQVRLEKWVAGECTVTEEYTLRGSVYLKPEVLLMLQVAGFREIAITGDYTGEPATERHEQIVFRAVK
jgi:SAM-dependent methyltransferase